MRLLHTADWHVGRAIRGRSRLPEFEAVLSEMIEIARAEEVEAILVCGDIWDSTAPSAEADRVVYEALRECVGHGIQVVLLAGNHDSPRRLQALGLLAELLGIQVQWQVRRPNAGGVLTVEGREHVARIAAVPFLQEGYLVDAAQVMGLQERWFSTYGDGAGQLFRAMCAGFTPETVNILAAHVFIDGAQLAALDGSERLLHIGQTYGVPPAALPADPQYIALGHIHQPQEIVNAPAKTAYAGSLLQLDFGEREQQKVVRVIDAVPGRPLVDHRAIPLTAGTPLVELHGTLEDVLRQRDALGEAHVRVALEVSRPEPGLAERVREQVAGTVDVRLRYERDDDAAEEEPLLGRLAPVDLFARYYRQQHGVDAAPDLLALFSELYESAAGEPADHLDDEEAHDIDERTPVDLFETSARRAAAGRG